MRLALPLSLSLAAFAQTGTIGGKIADEFGVPVSAASVQAKNTAGKQFKATSTSAGEYTIDKLPAGAYEVTVTALAMRNFVKKNFAVAGTGTSHLDVKLVAELGLGTLGDGDRFSTAFFIDIASTPPSGPVPRLPDGKPDLSGFWAEAKAGEQPQGSPPEQPDPLPWAAAIRQERETNNMRDIPSARCLPNFLRQQGRFVHNSSILVILAITGGEPPRQIFLDGREHPKELNPTWLGDSVGHWEGETLVVDTVGFNGLEWHSGGLPSTEVLHVVERYRRIDLGHMEAGITIEDPPVLRKPWNRTRILNLGPKEDAEEDVCTENNKDVEHLVGK
jgi:hypothetical protein